MTSTSGGPSGFRDNDVLTDAGIYHDLVLVEEEGASVTGESAVVVRLDVDVHSVGYS